MEHTFILYWYDNTTETIRGMTISDAFTKAGYGYGALAALDYYEQVN